ERKGVELLTGSNLTVDVQAKLASIEESVTVTAQSPLVEASQSTLSASIRQSEVVQLPMINRSMASLMNLLPGAREVGGAVSAYGRTQDMMAIDYFSKPENGGLGKPPFSRYQYGGSVGGPLVKDKAWFFGSMERTQQEYLVVRPARITAEHQYLEPLNIAVLP